MLAAITTWLLVDVHVAVGCRSWYRSRSILWYVLEVICRRVARVACSGRTPEYLCRLAGSTPAPHCRRSSR